jgi:hypothetical protein
MISGRSDYNFSPLQLLALQWHWLNLQAFKTISEKIKYCWQVIKVNYQVRFSKGTLDSF